MNVDNEFKGGSSALQTINYNMENKFHKDLFLAQHLDTPPKRDFIASIRSEYPHPEHLMSLNAEQREVVVDAIAALEGLVMIIGPPGSRKTYLAIQIAIPFLLDPGRHPILATSRNNGAADDLTTKFFDLNQYLIKTKVASRKRIIRFTVRLYRQ
jgi:PhoH-like protein